MPDEVDRQSLVNVAAMLGRNRAVEREPWPEDAPSIRSVRRSYALSHGMSAPGGDEPIGDDEYVMLLGLVTGGTRKVRKVR